MDVEMTGAALIRAAEAEVLRSPTDLIRLLVTGRGDVQVAEITSADRVGPPPHTQEWHEVQYVLEGEVEFWLQGEWHRLVAGDVGGPRQRLRCPGIGQGRRRREARGAGRLSHRARTELRQTRGRGGRAAGRRGQSGPFMPPNPTTRDRFSFWRLIFRP